MELDREVCERARLSRDRRFDGRFFIGVRTTGVYCRPVCPVRPPKSRNVSFFRSAAAAAESGYRPCLRCRPEAAPGTPAWLGTSATVSRALRLIEDGVLDRRSVEDLANTLGIGARHLGRLFHRHLGASPLAVAQTRRLHFAKRLLDETDLPMAQVALSAGFQSVRRFNTAFRESYDRTPTQIRVASKAANASACRGEYSLRLPFRSPFDWSSLLDFFAVRATPGVESVEAGQYRRTIELDGRSGTIEVARPSDADWLELRIRFPDSRALCGIVERVRRIFDLGADPESISRHLGADSRLGPLVRARPGLRVPGAWGGFELSVRAVLGQQVSVKGATTLAGRLVERFGEPAPDSDSSALCSLFPTPECLRRADVASIGMPRARARAVSALAAAVSEGEIRFDAGLDAVELEERMIQVPGIGAWTARYVSMRALGEPDAFPDSDLGLLRAVSGATRSVTPAELRSEAERWRPWRAYAALHLWRAEASSSA